MRFAYWSRELAGWGLIAIGLWQFWNTYVLLTNRRIFEAGPAAFIAFVVFRGGLHLLKVAVAAQAARSLADSAVPHTRKASRMATRSVAPTSAKSVIPGPKSRAVANGAAD
ncbi:hypothetical protein VT84_15475 [Gemmata sp. SH-PL17]|uniref:hypothetical protein n=1 Tax=Gemmata sp. SH-PL17 TaxID=1630693 RepID=UPI0004B32AAF|nr:hypothetical protein [Gemmata sp. SH-PL17]AMV25797.1 hypothetical protein VT84_15475 [Gemmata sp. SH-PL17]